MNKYNIEYLPFGESELKVENIKSNMSQKELIDNWEKNKGAITFISENKVSLNKARLKSSFSGIIKIMSEKYSNDLEFGSKVRNLVNRING